MSLPPTPSSSAREALRQFLAALYDPRDLVEVRPIEIWDGPTGRESRPLSAMRRWLSPAELLSSMAELYALNLDRNANIFMGVNPRKAAGGGTKHSVERCRCVWAEVDRVSAEGAALAWRQARLPTPSIVVASGNGVHGYWLLDEPLWFPTLPSRRRFESMLKTLYRDLKADATSDVSRLLRLPGFWNVKNRRHGSRPLPCTLVHCRSGLRYPLHTFDRWMQKKPRATTSPPSGKATTSINDVRVQQLTARLDLDVADRSARDFAIICELLRLGLTKRDIWPLVRDKSKFRCRGRDYFLRTVYNAAFHADYLAALD
ncbi:RepB family DNA primase [Aeoliella sp. ICT_H6.2]|uniref:RepB family DNA primase n=1 Tax=Aeoliella straminimaris TaxID=2954799 RepID=A0A9X2F6R3_9BACT|nr:DNA-primase RepB domain-containing protein [Aeoliella straminimaris]MCO6042693.1 RepB family DNA primase [Aeoliella straminimaris]